MWSDVNVGSRVFFALFPLLIWSARKIQAAEGNCEPSRALCMRYTRVCPHPQLYLSKAMWKVRLRVSRDARLYPHQPPFLFLPPAPFVFLRRCNRRCIMRSSVQCAQLATTDGRTDVLQCEVRCGTVCTYGIACHMPYG